MYPREVLDAVKAQILQETNTMRRANLIVPVSGERIDLPMADRKINIIYYRCGKAKAPLIMGYHGGGFLFGGNALNDAMWKRISTVLEADVVSVEYRKSPEYNYRAALEDASDAGHYLYEHAAEFGFDPEQMFVFGCSAGACLAATLCIYEQQHGKLPIKQQILMYPFLDSATDPDSKGEGSLSGPIMYVFNEMHCTPKEATDPEVSPVFATSGDLKDLPGAIMCLAEHDCLKAEGYRYAQMLRDAGHPCAVQEYAKMPHGFFESGFGKITEEEMSFLGEEVKAMIRSGEIARVSEEALGFVREHLARRPRARNSHKPSIDEF